MPLHKLPSLRFRTLSASQPQPHCHHPLQHPPYSSGAVRLLRHHLVPIHSLRHLPHRRRLLPFHRRRRLRLRVIPFSSLLHHHCFDLGMTQQAEESEMTC